MHRNKKQKSFVSVSPILVNIHVITVYGMGQYHKRYCKCVKTFYIINDTQEIATSFL